MTTRALIATAVAAAVIGVLALTWPWSCVVTGGRGDDQPPAVDPTANAVANPAIGVSEPGPAAAATDRADGSAIDRLTREPTAAERPHYVLMPDGSWVAALNGIEGAPKLLWDPDRPYSPIVERRRFEDGLEWYVHADQSRWTTCMLYRSELGREDASTVREHPRMVDKPVGIVPSTAEPVGGRGPR